MLIINDPKALMDFIKDDDRRIIKFVCISDRFYAVVTELLIRSDEFKALDRRRLPLTEELIDSFPEPRQSLDFVTPKLLKEKPIVMFECPGIDNRYWRHDGRHRCHGMWELGYDFAPAVFVPRSIWGKYIIGKNIDRRSSIGLLDNRKHDAEPYSWNRSPGAPKDGDGDHYELNIDIRQCPISYGDNSHLKLTRDLIPMLR